MKTTTAFAALNANRATRRNEQMKFLVKKLNKDGSVSRDTFTAIDWQFNAFKTQDAAEQRARDLEVLNPLSKFVVVNV